MDGAPAPMSGSPELTPDVKQQIADEVRNQLALENQEATQNAQQQDVDPASSGIARMVSDGRPHVFVVGSALDVVDNSQTECALSDGDVVTLRTSPPSDATVADVVVLSSKGGQECQKQATVSVALAGPAGDAEPHAGDYRPGAAATCRPSKELVDCLRCHLRQKVSNLPHSTPPLRHRPTPMLVNRFSSKLNRGIRQKPKRRKMLVSQLAQRR